MQPAELKKELRAKLPRRVGLVGREETLKAQALETIVATMVADGTRDYNLVYIDSERISRDTISELLQEPFASEFKVAVVRAGDPNLAAKHCGSHTVLVAWAGKLDKPEMEIDCKRLFGARLKTWIRSHGKSAGIALDKQDVDRLAQTFGSNLRELQNAVDKLGLLDRVDGPAVDRVCQDTADPTVWQLIAHVRDRNLAKAIETLDTCLEAGVHPLQAVAALSRQTRLVVRQACGIDVSEETGEAEAAQLEKIKGRMTADEAADMMSQITLAEWAMKEGAGPEKLFRLVFELCSRGGQG